MVSNILNEFPIFNKLDELKANKLETNYKDQIKYFHVFDKSAIFVTSKSNVYKISEIEQGPIQIEEINQKLNFCEFYGSSDLLFGREVQGDSSNSTIYFSTNYYQEHKPIFERLTRLDNKRIIFICIGTDQCLALSSQGLVYILEKSSILVRLGSGSIKLKQLNSMNKFKQIYCHKHYSFAVTIDGQVYVWTSADEELKQLNLPNCSNSNPINIVKISSYQNWLLLLDDKGHVFRMEEPFKSIAQRIDTQIKFIDINENVLQSEECVFVFRSTDQQLDEKSHIDFFDYYMKRSEGPVTKQTIKIERDFYNSWYLMTTKIDRVSSERQNETIRTNQSDQDILESKFQYVYCRNGYFKNKFNDQNRRPEYIAKQQCNVSVWRVQDQFNKCYAVKQINIKDNFYEVLREILVISQTKGSDFVVKFITAWIEWKVDEAFAYIQMEYCLCDLRKLIETKKQHFQVSDQSVQNMDKPECNLTFNLLLELSSCLNYLHSSEPPIIHRDLKPENILLSKDKRLKICDFGLSKLFKNSKNTRGLGTQDYIAPELWNEIYDLSVDHFSLGQISKDMFYFKKEGQIDIECYSGTELEQLFNNLTELLSNMTSDEPDIRPKCKQIRESFENFLKLTPNSDENLNSIISSIIDNFKNSFTI